MRRVAPPRRRAAQAGISLVETLVALVLGLAMVSVAFNLYVSNRAVFRQIEAIVRLQESASVAAALLETSIRHAGGTLCRNNTPTTTLLNAKSPYRPSDHKPTIPYAYWERWGKEPGDQIGAILGLHGYEAFQTDPIVGSLRLAGDSISIMSDNMGKVAKVIAPATYASAEGSGGLTGSYTFTVDNASDFPVGTVAMACDYTRAVLFQVTEPPTASTIKLQANEGTPLSPGNCAVTMRRRVDPGYAVAAMDTIFSCSSGAGLNPRYGEMYPFGPGSMIGEHTFHHWYVGKNTSTGVCCSLRRVRTVYKATGVDSIDEEIVENVTDMQITYLPGWLGTGYPADSFYKVALSDNGAPSIGSNVNNSFAAVTAVRIVLTLTSPDKVGLAANNAASAATYTIPINVAIRSRMLGVVRR